MTEGSKRLVATLPADTFAKLDQLTEGPRFAGNRSKTLAWAVELAAVVLQDAAVKGTLFATPADAMTAFLATRRK